MGMMVASGIPASAQAAAAQDSSATQTRTLPDAVVTGGRLHGTVKSGNTSLPGVTVTAQNTLTGKRFSTITDISGAWSLNLVQNGRYVIRTQFAAFAPGAQEAVLNASGHDQTVSFDLLLASRASQQQQEGSQDGLPSMEAIRQLAANGAQNLSLLSSISDNAETQIGGSESSGAALPSIASNSNFGNDSVAISGQSGSVSPLAGMDMDRIRDAIETLRAQGGIPEGNFGGGGLFGGGGFGGAGGFGGGFGGAGDRGGGGHGNFRGFNPAQPHGAIFWTGSNSTLNAEPFSLSGQPQEQPASGTNRFGITFMSAPYIPGWTKPSGKDSVFLTLSGSRSSNPTDQYANVPTDAARAGDFSVPGMPVIYNPATQLPFANNYVPISVQAAGLLKYFPEPNLSNTSNSYNYHLLTTAQSNSSQAGVRYMRSLGKNATLLGTGHGGGGRRSQNQGLRQSINFNYNWSDSASDNVNIFPQLGGKSASQSNSLQGGYTVGYHKLTSIFNANWNRNSSQTTNFFTNGTDDVASDLHIQMPDSSPINYGIPNIILSNFTGLSQQQPYSSLSQTIALSETLSWIHGKHNFRFGGDYRRVHRDFLGGSNSTGTFTFSGKFTEDTAQDPTTGSSLADFLLGYPQETTIDVAASKSYLRDNVWDVYVQDDWRIRTNLTLNFGMRYEFFAPYTEKFSHLTFVNTNPSAGFTTVAEAQAGVGFSDSLVHPFYLGLSPRFGLAWRLPKQTVVRGGYGINYSNGQYATFASTMARQPLVNQPTFINEQTNEATAAGQYSMANGFPNPATIGNYALDPHYKLPYVQVYNIDLQKTLRWGVVVNAGYNGSKGNRLDITSAPRTSATSPNTDPANQVFNYEQAAAFSRFNAGTLRVNKRMSSGISLGVNYQYSHSIDDAGSVGGTSTVVAQNWQDLAAEEGNSSFDQRHKVSGTYLYELPFGKDTFWLTTGTASHIFEGFSVSGSYTFATGTPLTPSYQAAIADVARGTAGTLRPDRVPAVSITAGGGSLKQWFNTAVFATPAGLFGTASRNSITGPGTIQNNMTLSKTMQLGDMRSMEIRATANNVFNTVQYSGVNTSLARIIHEDHRHERPNLLQTC